MRRFIGVMLLALVLSVFATPHRASYAAPTVANPTLIAEVNGPGKGRVWAGAIPAGSSTKPVLVFVHGLHGKGTNWWGATEYYGTNDMYLRAYNSGYRTAFVSLNDEVDGPAENMWTNGATLNRQLDVILAYYGVSTVNIIAHSKGGVDTNSAVIHYGASSKVQKIITLSSPHHGSQLADLAYSWWAGWLAELIGQKDNGTYSMQTSYMSYFRSVTDGSSNYSKVRFYTSGGKDHGPWFSAMWFGGGYLPGDNDGVVTVISSNHPKQYSRMFTSSSLNHDNIRKGSDVWGLIEPTARTFFRSTTSQTTAQQATGQTTVSAHNELTEENPLTVAVTEQPANQILRGGKLNSERASVNFPLENGISKVRFDVMGSSDALAVTFIAPNGRRFAASAPVLDTEMFAGAWHYTLESASPMAGNWTVEIKGAKGSAYLMVASIDGGATVTSTAPTAVKPGTALDVTVSAGKASQVQAEALLSGTPTGRQLTSAMPTRQTITASGTDRANLRASAPSSVGLYQYGLTIRGTTAEGFAFERSVPLNFAVLNGNEGLDALPAGR